MENEFFMHKEIQESVKLIKEYSQRKTEFEGIYKKISNYDPNTVIFISRGTSDNAATYGKYVFEYAFSIPSSFASFSLYTWYKRYPKLKNVLGIAISQSGETEDVVKVVETFNKENALSIGITNNENSRLYKISDIPFLLRGGEEHSVSATKTYTLTLMFFLHLANFVLKDIDFESLHKGVLYVLKNEDYIAKLTERYKFAKHFFILGRGFNYPTALEFALKLRETSIVNAVGFSSVDFLHGPIASLTNETPVIFFLPKDETYDSNLAILKRIKDEGGDVLVVSDVEGMNNLSFKIPSVSTLLYPVVFAIFLQLFSFYLSREKGLNPDKPSKLKKVTYGI
jgi:glucosamine--fructose-6-phosphate aminotransferase (isomerizing)